MGLIETDETNQFTFEEFAAHTCYTEINRALLLSERGAAIRREIPVGRFGEDGDLDGALLLLASDAGRFIAGATIVVDGGQSVALRG